MQPKNTKKTVLILAIVFAVLLATFLILYFTLREEEAPPIDDETILLWSIPNNVIDRISYDYQGETITLYRENGAWQVENEVNFPLNTYLVLAPSSDCMMSRAMDISYQKKVSDRCENKTLYGLQSPALTLRITVQGYEHIFYFGNRYAKSDSRYCQKAGDDALYLIEEAYFTSFAYTKTQLISHPFSPNFSGVTAQSATWDGTTVTDATALATFVPYLESVKFDYLADYRAEAKLASYGLDESARKTLTFSFTQSLDGQAPTSESYVLHFGKCENGFVYFYHPEKPYLVYQIVEAQFAELISIFNP